MNKLKVTYEKVEMSLNDIAKAMIDGAVFYNETGTISFRWVIKSFCNSMGSTICIEGDFYRKAETQDPWYENITKGVMCKVWDNSPTVFGYAIISHYDARVSIIYPFKSKSYMYYSQTSTSSRSWKNAEPIKKSDYNFAEDL